MAGMRNRNFGPKPNVKNPSKIFKRVLAIILKKYWFQCLIVLIGIIGSTFATVLGTMFMQRLIDDYILPMTKEVNPSFTPLAGALLKVAGIYLIGILCNLAYQKIMVYVSQGTLKYLRIEIFNKMESLPIKYFDTHPHGDIMSVYTNDVDTLRQLISQSIPQVLNSIITIIGVFVSTSYNRYCTYGFTYA